MVNAAATTAIDVIIKLADTKIRHFILARHPNLYGRDPQATTDGPGYSVCSWLYGDAIVAVLDYLAPARGLRGQFS
jgi:hypothetical protein